MSDLRMKDISGIVLAVSSDKCTIRLSGFDEDIEACRENAEPDEKYLTHIDVKAFAVDDEGEKIKDIGFLRGVYFEAEVLFLAEISFAMLCDSISSDAFGLAEAITDKRGNIKPSICDQEENLMYINEVFVEDAYRGHGVGQYLLNNLAPLLAHSLNLRPHAYAVLPYPQEKALGGGLSDATETAAADLPRLIRFYEKAGFTKINGGKYMYKKIAGILDELFEMLKE